MRKIARRSAGVGIGLVLIAALAGSAGATTSTPSSPSNVPPLPAGWVADEVAVPTDLGTVWGTWTHPRDVSDPGPAALIIGGSGPTDRDGNTANVPLAIDNLAAVASWLADDGVATLRTDKPGSGKTGLGDLTAASAAAVTVDDYLTMNAQLLTFVASQPGVDARRLGVVGHSEGGLFALLLGANQHGAAHGVPAVQAIAGLEPQAGRILDVLTAQVTAQVQQGEATGNVSAADGAALRDGLAAAVAAVRAGSPLPADLPAPLAGLFPATVLTYLRTDDAIDPPSVAAQLPAGMPVLLSCSDADIQVACADVERLAAAASAAGADVTLSHLTDMAHTLKVDPSGTSAHYGDDLPFSPQLRQAVSTWTQQW
jgi:uncharacterized protein